MTPKATQHIIRGMRQDTSNSKASKEFAFHNHNIRITAREGHTLLSITNEKMPSYINDTQGNYIGHCVLGDYLVLFIHHPNNGDRIEIASKDELETFTTIYEGNLKFSTDNPIEALGVYENEYVQKVYWVDGKNQPRVINIAATDDERVDWNDKSFDFVPEIKLEDSIEIEYITGSSSFAPGVIQYAFSYYNKYGQESNIFNTSQLCYLANKDRGASPEEIISDQVIKIDVLHPDTSFDFLRVYSIHRTSLDSTPTVKILRDVPLTDTTYIISIYDNGVRGEIIDPSVLLYTGGEHIIAGNICAKDNTLFLGNIELIRNDVIENIKNQIIIEESNLVQNIDTSDYYYCNNNKLNNLSYYTPKEIYRLGLQFQYSSGKWSSPIFIGDYTLIDPDIKVQIIDNKIYLPTFKIKLNSNIQKELNKIGVIRCRSLVVFPNINERKIIDSGIVCPTLFNIENREKNNPYSQSSWFFRPIKFKHQTGDFIELYNTNNEDIASRSSTIEFRDGVSLIKPWIKGSEIQSGTDYFIDYSILTYHSPHTEFEDIDISKSNIKARITGVVVLESELSNLDILDSGPFGSLGVIKSEIGTFRGNTYSGLFYRDRRDNNSSILSYYMVYPWHRSGSLNFDNALIASDDIRAQSAILKNKKLLNFKISKITHEIERPIELSLLDIKKYNNNFIQIPTNDSYRNYLGEINRPIIPEESYGIYKSDSGDKLYFNSAQNSNDPIEITYKSTPHYVLSIGYKDPFPINKQVSTLIDKVGKTKGKRAKELYRYYSKYSSSETNSLFDADIGEIICIENDTSIRSKNLYIKVSNFVSKSGTMSEALSTDWEPYLNKDVVLFSNNTDYSTGYDIFVVIYTNDNGELTIETDNYNDFDTKIISNIDIPSSVEDPDQDSITSFLYMVELYRDINENTIFGGSTQADIENNTWLPASKPYNINNEIFWEYGDTRYQRYDCLKTYSYSAEDKNQVMDIVSFMCETRLNMLGRYDKNIGKIENLNITPTNFNLFNPVYSQKDNFFNYRILDEDLYKRNSFSNTITWSKEKHSGEEIDTWTNITMASTLDVDGTKGPINKLVVSNDKILCFQDKGISQILFNSRVQIPTSDGVPIEITNGYKVDGFRYISDGIGSKNKNSITVTPSGVYFLDSNSNSIYLLTEGLTNLSTEKGFEIWTKKVANDSSFKTFYDNANKDVYFTTKDECLGYSEKLGEFTSFYDYYNSDSMFNIGNSFYRLYYNSTLCLDKMFAGDYTNNYSIEFITNEDPQVDKVFTNIDYRADFFDSNNKYLENESFDTLEVWNEYQRGKETLKYSKFKPSNLKKKFRVWSANIPRDNKNKLDRMRNPWLHIKLSKNNPGISKMELHDIVVKYLE